MRIKFLITIAIVFTISQLTLAQYHSRPKCKMYREEIKAKQVAYITHKLNFSVEEAQQFWPIFNERHAQIDKIREEIHQLFKNIRVDKDLSEKTSLEFLNKHASLLDEERKIHKKFEKELLNILPPQKVLLLHLSEKDFKREIVKEMREKPCNNTKEQLK